MSGEMRWRWVLVVWTLVIWGSRARNAIQDDDLTSAARNYALFIALAFIALALGVAFDNLRQHAITARTVFVLVVAGILRWTLRGPEILLGDEWSTNFKVVHTFLWLGTVVLSVLAWREWRRFDDRLDS